MPECKRCGARDAVKSGRVRGKQRYLCKQCGCHFVEGDERERDETPLLKTLCALFGLLGVGQHRTVGSYLDRDISQIHRWMSGALPKDGTPKGHAKECLNIGSLSREIGKGGAGDGPFLMADGVAGDLYVAIVVGRNVSIPEDPPGSK